jgi:LuxR family transcriptional regulator, maltose regulon positive regulatory protein
VLSFARTKIQRPQPRPGALIPRPALTQRLTETLATHPLVLLQAAAGFGKTSALVQALDALPQGCAVAWVACDEGDTPLQLFACLVAALEPYDLPWRIAPDSLIEMAAANGNDTPESRAKSHRRLAAELINALDASEAPHGVIVVDDLHRVTHPAVFEFIDVLMERFTPRWCMAIASRETPPLALARLRAAGELAEFALDALRFDQDESMRVVRAAGLAADTAQALHARTAGWPAGLRLALSALASMPGAGLDRTAALIDRRVFEFLATEVLDRLPSALREFLLTTSVLPELSAARCAALTGDARAADKLDAIERAGLFVSVLTEPDAGALPTMPPTLRLHDLFRDALENRLQRERPGQWSELLRRAAAVESDPLRRIGGLMRAEAWSDAEAAVAEVGEELITQGDAAAIGTLLGRFPAAQRSGSGALLLLTAKLAWSRWDWHAMLGGSSDAAAAFLRVDDRVGHAHALTYQALALIAVERLDEARAILDALLARSDLDDAAAARALMAQGWIEFSHGDQRRVGALWTRLIDHLDRTHALASWYECMPIPSYASLPGMRTALARYVLTAKARWPDRPSPPRGMCTAIEGMLHLWGGDLERAAACAAQASDDAKWLGRPINLDAYAMLLLALLHAVQGRSAQAQALVEQRLDAVMATGDPVHIGMYRGVCLYQGLRCAAAADDIQRQTERAAQLLAHAQDAPLGLRGMLTGQYVASARAYAAAAAGDHDAARQHWQALLALEHECDQYAQVPDARLRLASALLHLGRPAAEAVEVLTPLFERIEASGERGLPLVAGPTVLRQLAAANWSAQLAVHRVQQLQHWAAAAAPAREAASVAAAAPAITATATNRAAAVGLSEREREVLERIAAGESNKLIARAFDLSPHTVKRHVANILDKLALRSRGQAAAWYHEHAA